MPKSIQSSSKALIRPPRGLFERIIASIRNEEELRKTKRIAVIFLFLLVISVISLPFSWSFLSTQLTRSGFLTFLALGLSNLGAVFSLFPEFVMAVAESLPVMGLTVFILNVALVVFTIRLFLYRKRLLWHYFIHGMRFA